MARKKAQEVTPESVDEMTDEQVTEFMSSMGEDQPDSDAPVDEEVKAEGQASDKPEELFARGS